MATDLYTPTMLDKAPRRFRYIIIHDTSCHWDHHNTYKIDMNLFQAGPMRARFKSEKRYHEMPYHFVCEKIGSNYQTFIGRPLQYSCIKEYPDLDNMYAKFGIHVCVMGSYMQMNQVTKMYEQLCYRVIAPMMKTFKIPKSRIFMHGELSKEHVDCPGFNFSKNTMMTFLTKYLMGTTS